MDSTYFLRQLDIADPSKFRDKRVAVDRGLTITASLGMKPAMSQCEY